MGVAPAPEPSTGTQHPPSVGAGSPGAGSTGAGRPRPWRAPPPATRPDGLVYEHIPPSPVRMTGLPRDPAGTLDYGWSPKGSGRNGNAPPPCLPALARTRDHAREDRELTVLCGRPGGSGKEEEGDLLVFFFSEGQGVSRASPRGTLGRAHGSGCCRERRPKRERGRESERETER